MTSHPFAHEGDVDILATRIHQNARDKGFWPQGGRNFGEMLMLITSEIAEALEADRDGEPVVWLKHTDLCLLSLNSGLACTCTPKPEGAAVELADAIIRTLDTLQHILDGTPYIVSEVIAMKMAYNETRPNKHGKAY